MRVLAISGSTRLQSTNSALLAFLSEISPPDINITLYDGLLDLPIFSADLEGEKTPAAVQRLCDMVERSDGIIISSPEYVRAIPGGLKNAVDWLVPRDAIINKPIVLLHASHRGDEMLTSLRRVLHTVTRKFQGDNFLQFELMSKTPEEIRAVLAAPENVALLRSFLSEFRKYITDLADVTG
jgi:NAD(P)H-dependent FMN reductase